MSIDSAGRVHHLGILNEPIVDFADLDPPITHYAELFQTINLAPAAGLAAAGGIGAVFVFTQKHHDTTSAPASP